MAVRLAKNPASFVVAVLNKKRCEIQNLDARRAELLVKTMKKRGRVIG